MDAEFSAWQICTASYKVPFHLREKSQLGYLKALFRPIAIFILRMLLASIFMLMIQNYIVVIMNWSTLFSVLSHSFFPG